MNILEAGSKTPAEAINSISSRGLPDVLKRAHTTGSVSHTRRGLSERAQLTLFAGGLLVIVVASGAALVRIDQNIGGEAGLQQMARLTVGRMLPAFDHTAR